MATSQKYRTYDGTFMPLYMSPPPYERPKKQRYPSLPRLLACLGVFVLASVYYAPFTNTAGLFSPFTDLSMDSLLSSQPDIDLDRTLLDEPPYKAIIAASLSQDDTTWIQDLLPDWQANVYVVDDPTAILTVPKNKGRESSVYLTYIIDNYHKLPAYMLFSHADRYQWHNEDPMYDGVPVIQNLQLSYLDTFGYANLRCTWQLGCPLEIEPFALPANETGDERRAMTEAVYATAFTQLLPNVVVPEQIGVPAGGQFAVTRSKVLERPLQHYEHFRQWLYDTDLDDHTSGRVFEYTWHIIFGMPSVYCPAAGDCFCQKFGICNIKCNFAWCDGRYVLPPASNFPPGWPESAGMYGFVDDGWWLEEEETMD